MSSKVSNNPNHLFSLANDHIFIVIYKSIILILFWRKKNMSLNMITIRFIRT